MVLVQSWMTIKKKEKKKKQKKEKRVHTGIRDTRNRRGRHRDSRVSKLETAAVIAAALPGHRPPRSAATIPIKDDNACDCGRVNTRGLFDDCINTVTVWYSGILVFQEIDRWCWEGGSRWI